MSYKVLNNDHEEIGNFRSVKKAVEAAEQYFQCGISEELVEVKRSLRSIGSAIVSHAVFNEVLCHIDKISNEQPEDECVEWWVV